MTSNDVSHTKIVFDQNYCTKKTIKSSLQYSPHRPAAFAGSSGSPCDALQHVGSSQAASFPMTYLGS